MGRHRYRGARGSDTPSQRDTPLKAAPSRRDRGRRHNRHEDIPEEPEEAGPKEEEAEPKEEEAGPKEEEAEPVPLFVCRQEAALGVAVAAANGQNCKPDGFTVQPMSCRSSRHCDSWTDAVLTTRLPEE
ncbi:hypothetical protein EYF80_051925 [Liparis tanakae]|uniref:Uncharacterized protein n=1 Tax=Liparis tanakae TaxID=230148 RepID=A0A4Z2F9Q0_9TELE|nr:hypothetical protein EYF80_051925 [Liparis tanakae]